MSDLIWLSEAQMRRIEPYFPLSHGVPRVDDRRIISDTSCRKPPDRAPDHCSRPAPQWPRQGQVAARWSSVTLDRPLRAPAEPKPGGGRVEYGDET
ncbi:MAG: hypothetical protein EOS10_34970 [Mesorhizobium sp.]|nr:MAG: hypothetical protein EOS10_34970 [Mesorhizobium sp.]